ncbi:MAG: hypothetical protein KAU58_06015 [Candidatus Omnitrophica bacterium]|nr:hypothetical protein [Candidatus Omnitrophota bacterium]
MIKINRLNKADLMKKLSGWNAFLRRKIHLIACGGTALTLLDIKESTKDIDFMIPLENDYKYLIRILSDLGYVQDTGYGWKRTGEIYSFDLFMGNFVFTTGLIESPLAEGNNILIKEFSHIFLGTLNYYDLIISKIFRGSTQDFEDCFTLIKTKSKEIDRSYLQKRFKETASYEPAEDRVNKQFDYFISKIEKDKL